MRAGTFSSLLFVAFHLFREIRTMRKALISISGAKMNSCTNRNLQRMLNTPMPEPCANFKCIWLCHCLCVGCAIDGRNPKIREEKRHALNNDNSACFLFFAMSLLNRRTNEPMKINPLLLAHSLLILLANWSQSYVGGSVHLPLDIIYCIKLRLSRLLLRIIRSFIINKINFFLLLFVGFSCCFSLFHF